MRDKKGVLNTFSKVVVGKRQRFVTVPKTDCKFFNKKLKIYPFGNDDLYLLLHIYPTSNGNQKIVTIPKVHWDLFPEGLKVVLSPFNNEQETNKKEEGENSNEQISTEEQV